MIRGYLWNKLEGEYFQIMQFQKDNATGHIFDETLNLLRDKFGNRRFFEELKVIGQLGRAISSHWIISCGTQTPKQLGVNIIQKIE